MRQTLYRVILLVIVILAVSTLSIWSLSRSGGALVTTPLQSSGCGKSSLFMSGKSVNETMTSGGLTRSYRLHLPINYQRSVRQPIVVNFHGHGSNAMEQESRSNFSALADLRDFIVVYPQGAVGSDHLTGWATGPLQDPQVNDVLFVSDLLTYLQTTLCIDPYRVYATGFSNGGGMANLLACRLADRIAAFALVSGSYPPVPGGCHPQRSVPLLEFHGTADNVVPYAGSVPKGYPPIATWLQGWVALDGCITGPTTFLQTKNVMAEQWTGHQKDAIVVHYRLQDQAHVWPQSILDAHADATSLIWSFFEAHLLPSDLHY